MSAGQSRPMPPLEDHERPEVLAQWLGANDFRAAVALESRARINIQRPSGRGAFDFTLELAATPAARGTFEIARDARGSTVVSTTCSCRRTGCVHGKAAFLRIVAGKRTELRAIWNKALAGECALPSQAETWLRVLSRPVPVVRAATAGDEPESQIVFVVGIGGAAGILARLQSMRVWPYKRREGFAKNTAPFTDWQGLLTPTGGAVRSPHYNYGQLYGREFDLTWVAPAMRQLAKHLFLADALPQNDELSLRGASPDETIARIAQGCGLYWGSQQGPRLRVGRARPATVQWHHTDTGDWRLMVQTDPPVSHFLATSPPWYCDPDRGEVGPLLHDLPESLLLPLLEAPTVPTAALSTFAAALRRIPGAQQHVPPLPNVKVERLGMLRPLAVLTLRSDIASASGPVLELAFDYLGRRISTVGNETLHFETKNALKIVERDVDFEMDCGDRLLDLGLNLHSKNPLRFVPAGAADPSLFFLGFQKTSAEDLRQDGWVVLFHPDFEYRLAIPGEWKLQLDPTEPGWYEASMGVVIDGATFDLVDLLRDMLADRDLRKNIATGEEGTYYQRIGQHGDWLPVSYARLRQISGLLLDLEAGTPGTRPRISRFDLGWLETAEHATGIALSGHERLQTIARDLAAEPKDIPAIVPAHPTKPLWPSQRKGVGWLQALLKHGFGGVLADDMGLGKTRTVLTHILAEKLSGRAAGRPSLLVMSKTLFAKWEAEVHEFTPELRSLRVHGNSRQRRYQDLAAIDVVLISYATLANDIESLGEIEWHVVALDEGHRIGNVATQRAKAAAQVRAQQRVVITGTPLQNRLEEYWAVFNFAVPGLLRSRTWFRQRFVRGQTDALLQQARLHLLGQITAPFLRMTPKEEVKGELPPLTRKVITITLEGRQRELYETVRARLDKELRAKIAASGLGQSHIAVLAAITQLRQVCCDPSLLNLDTAKDIPSAKLVALRELMAELIAAKHRPIIFSQWTSMLDRIGAALDEDGITYSVLTGETPDRQRPLVQQQFRSGVTQAMLLSLKVGGEGIDLPESDTVIIYDPWWNPKAEEQAVKRAHRHGQKNPVLALRLIAAGSVEEGIVTLGERKTALAEAIFEGASGGLKDLSMTDIDTLFAPLSDNDED